MQLNFIYKSLFLSLFVLFFTACGGGGDSTTATSPTTSDLHFTSSATLSVSENQLEAITLVATGGDGDSLIYTMSGTDEAYFDLNSSSGVVSFKVAPDYETKALYSFDATVNDGNATVSEAVSITIVDVADVVPELADFMATVAENLPAETILGSLTVVNEGDSSIYSYTLSDTTNFSISSSGVITTNKSFDFEALANYTLTAYATNLAGNSANITLDIAIANVADIVPQLSDTSMSVDENQPAGTFVGKVSVADSGDSDISAYTLSDTTYFSVENSGDITTKQSFDYETKASYSLTVYATNDAGDSVSVDLNISINDLDEAMSFVPTLVVVMNWDDYSENDASLWYDKFFNPNENSVNQWLNETMQGSLNISPVTESSGTKNDGIIMVNMGKKHPGGSDSTSFRDTEIENAITSAEVVDNVDFAALDLDGNEILNTKELQIIFIVAGGEESYGDAQDHSIWAHQWSFSSHSGPVVDDVSVMQYSSESVKAGTYARFGANHGDHQATIGVIVHEMGHSMLNLHDYYDDGGGSGLGWYDIMSGGSWAYKNDDIYAGATPTQYSAYNRIDVGIDTGIAVNLSEVDTSQELTLECSSNQLIKLVTAKANEYFLLECRDTAKANSDISFDGYDSDFTEDRLFTMLYHVDSDKDDNTEDGAQTDSNHYKVALVEKDTATLMTSSERKSADFDDVYLLGDTIDESRTDLYDGTATGYALEISAEDYTDRTMTIKITKN